MSSDILNVEQAAEFLGFAPYTIREKVRLGEIPGKKMGGEWRFSRRLLLAFVEVEMEVEDPQEEIERLRERVRKAEGAFAQLLKETGRLEEEKP